MAADIVARSLAIKAEEGGGGGTTVVANPTLAGTEPDLTGLQVGTDAYAIKTYKKFDNSWTTTGTTKQFLDAINADTDAVEGMVYLGDISCSDLPASMNNVEAIVEIIRSAVGGSKVIHTTITSGNTAPYRWERTYWNNGTNDSGWIAFSQVTANPTLVGTESNLTGIEVNGTKYKVTSDVQSVNGETGVVVLDKSDIGLGNVDNTSDANKPVSTATQTALNAKQATLVSGTNIKTINNQSILGEGNITISGGSGPDYSKIVISEDTVTITEDQESEGTYYLQADNFVNFMQEVICSSDNLVWWTDYMAAAYTGSYESTNFMPKDYRFSFIFKDNHCNSCSSSMIADKGVYPYPGSLSEINWEEDGYGYPAGQSYIQYIPSSETSGFIEFYFLNGNETVEIEIGISIDDSGDDPELVFPDGEIQITYTGDDEVENIDKLIVWTPSCNTHFESAQPATSASCTQYVASALDFIGKHINVDKLIALLEDVDPDILSVDVNDMDRCFCIQLFNTAATYGYFYASNDFNIICTNRDASGLFYSILGSSTEQYADYWEEVSNPPEIGEPLTLQDFLDDNKSDIEAITFDAINIQVSTGTMNQQTLDGSIVLSSYRTFPDYLNNTPIRITYGQLMSIFDDVV